MSTEAPTTEIVRETVAARHDFSESERLKLSESLVQSMSSQTQIDDEFSSVKAEFKCRIEKAKLETDSFAQKLRDGFEMRQTLARVLFNVPTPGRKTYVREPIDGIFPVDISGIIIREEPMSYGDEHRPLFKDANGQDATATKLPDGTFPDDDDGNPVDPSAGESSPAAHDAGTTSLGDVLGAAAASTSQPLLSIALDEPGWTVKGLRKDFITKAKLAKWPEVAIDLITDAIAGCDGDLEKVKETIRPQTVGGQAV